MRPFLALLIFIAAVAYSESIDVTVLYKLPVPEATLKSISRVVKRISTDNRYITANLLYTNCVSEEATDRDLCSEINNGFSISIKGGSDVNLERRVLIGSDEVADTENILMRLIINFSTSIYTARAEDNDAVDWWSIEDGSLRTVIESKKMTSEQEIYSLTTDDKAKHAFVLYYRPEHFTNFAALFYTTRAVATTKASFGLVDCSVASELCSEYETLPVLVSIWREDKYSRFEGKWREETIRDWILTLRHPVITQLTEDIVPMYRSGIVPGFETKRDTVTMLFVPTKDEPVYRDFKRFAKENHGKYHLTSMVNKNVRKWAHQPAFITMKPLEHIQQAFVMYKDLSYNSIVEFIENGIYPSVHDMTSASTVLEALSLPRPLFIFFDPEGTRNSTEFQTLAAEHSVRSKDAAFAIIKGVNLFGLFINEMLSTVGEIPRPSYVLVDTQKGCIHRELIANDNQQQIRHWLQTTVKLECEQEFNLDLPLLSRVAEFESRSFLQKTISESKVATEKHEEL